MYGAIIGDVVGSKYEFNNTKRKDFPFYSKGCSFTDDTIMTVAVGKAIIEWDKNQSKSFEAEVIKQMQAFGNEYRYPKGGYGARFGRWLCEEDPQPYNSWGNGSAMRVSACGIYANSLEEAAMLAEKSASVTHNHLEGVKGAKATACAIYLAKIGKTKSEIKTFVEENYYSLNRHVDEIRETYYFNESCQGTVPEAITCFLESTDFEDAIRNAISIGGDSDTVGAICGSIAYAYYGYDGKDEVKKYLPESFIKICDELEEISKKR